MEENKKVDGEATAEPVEKKSKKSAAAEKEEKLLKEIEDLKSQAADFKDKWMRNVAEFDNYKKRNAKVWQDAYNEGIASVIMKILPVGDNLDWALSLGLDEKTEQGIKGIRKKFDETLSSLEVEEINPVGKPFDPNEAEAVMQVEGAEGEESDTVKQVFQKGYRKKDKIIRYAKVSVIK
jgi:molecular chaperone GrpE